jgi:hypothetical protein
MLMLRTKVYRPDEMKVIDEDRGIVSAIVSSEKQDRDGDVIRADGWNLGNFMRHPVLLANHDYHSLRSQIGEWQSMEVNGTQMKGVARFYIGRGNAEADWAFELAKEKQLAFSVGFIPDMTKAAPLEKSDAAGIAGMEFKGQELLEVSAVTVPSNPDALQRIIKSPDVHPVVAEIVEERIQLSDERDLVDEAERSITDDVRPELVDMIVERVLDRLEAVTATPPNDDEPTADDDQADEDDYGDGDEPPTDEKSSNEEPFDVYAAAIAATEEALEEELV